MDETTVAKATEYARSLGTDAGRAAASWWCIDGNTSEDTLRSVLKGIEDGDPVVLDTFPTPNLSGEWAGDPTPVSLAQDVAYELDVPEQDMATITAELCDAWEDAAWSAVQTEIERTVRYLLSEE